ncbi:hypothetical protein [uncultured Rikenella sp.]|uniref:hypothetical protein n=1 Tax=uncultured Rikenella sp. TaxID=368003 RepID=UPI00261B147D|nr:hypothetical protein [uncultured Rikenella sp.]
MFYLDSLRRPCPPAPGFRERAQGSLSSVGYLGYSWSSSISDLNGQNLNFGITWLDPSRADYRVYGFQLRCLSE